MPWRLPDELANFKRLTLGKPVVMGRNTYESLGKPLQGRRNVVLTHRAGFEAPGCEIVGCLDAAFERCAGAEEIMVIGGASVFEQCLPRASRIYLTRVEARVEADTRFPAFDPADWDETPGAKHSADARHEFAFRISTLVRKRMLGR